MFFESKIFSNSLWMMLEKFLGIFGLIFINSYMAKYIGPENFGKLAFTTSIFIFVQTLSWFGAQNILFKRFSENIQSGISLATSTKSMRCYIYILTSTFALTYLWFSSDALTFIFGLGNCIASYFLINDIFSIYNNSQLTSIINALTNIVGLILALTLRFILVFFEADAYTMIFPVIIVAMIPFFLRKIYFYKKNKILKNEILKNKLRYSKYMFVTGGSLVLSTLSIALYTQISNIFLVKFSSFSDVGIYNVALALGSASGFINVAIITSYFSKIYSIENYSQEMKYLKQIHWIIIMITFFILLGTLWGGGWIIKILYGTAFIEAVELLPYIIIGTMLSALGTISYRYMIKFSAYKYLSIKMFLVALFSIPLSYVLIQNYGVIGAVLCFVITEFFSLTIANYFFKKRLILNMHLKVMGW